MAEREEVIAHVDTAGWATRDEWDAPTVACPVCGGDYTHPMSVRVNQNGDVVDVTRCKLDAYKSPVGTGRGSEISLRFYCENGHTFRLDFQFHKGQTFARTAITEPLEMSMTAQLPDELWRD